MPPARFTALLLVFALGASTRVSAASFEQTMFMTGAPFASPVLLREPLRSAAEAQRGPNTGETRAAYGERLRRAGLALGLTPAQADAARDMYLRRHAARWTAATPRPPAVRPDLRATRGRVDRALRAPAWVARVPEPAPASTRLLLPSEASARLDPSIAAILRQSAPRRQPAVVPARREPARAGGDLPTFWEWAGGGAPGRDGHRASFYDWAARYNARADSITSESTGDSVGGWLSRKSYRLAASASSVFGWLNDDDAPGRMWNGLTETLGDAASGLGRAVRERPAESALIGFLAMSDPGRTASMIGAADGRRRGRLISASVSRAWDSGRTWDALDATYVATSEVAEVASYAAGVPALTRRVVIREALDSAGDAAATGLPRLAPRAWLPEAGANDALARVLESNYRRLNELERQFVSRRAAGAPAAELDAIRDDSWRLYNANARELQPQIPALRDWFAANPAPGTPGSRVYMEAVAANMGVELVTLPRGVRLAGERSLRRDLDAGGILPNPNKLTPDGELTGSGAHLLRDGSPHMVSVAERLNPGIVLLMTGYADARRLDKTTSGILYEFEGVADAARLPEARQIFHGALNQREYMVPQVPMDRVRRVSYWRAELNPSDARELFFDYTDSVALAPGADAEAIMAALRAAPRSNRYRVRVPTDAEAAAATSLRAP